MGNWLGLGTGGRLTYYKRPGRPVPPERHHHDRRLQNGTRVRAAYMSHDGPMYSGTIEEVDEEHGTASIAYDDGGYWDSAPFDAIQVLDSAVGSDSETDSNDDSEDHIVYYGYNDNLSDNSSYISSDDDGDEEEEIVNGTCPICLEEKEISCHYNQQTNENFNIIPCQHQFCKECFSKYVNTVIESGAWQVRCPEEKCNYVLSAKDAERILPQSKYEEWQAARNKSYYDRFMSNDQEMRDALKVDKLVAKEIKKRKREEDAKSYWKAKKLKLDDATQPLGHGVRVQSTYMSDDGPRYKGTILEVDVPNATASIEYDDGDFWGEAPLALIQVLGSNDEAEQSMKEGDIVVGKRVMARWNESRTFYPGVITSVDGTNRTVSVQYDDGAAWDRCPFHEIGAERNPQEDESSSDELKTLDEEDIVAGRRVIAGYTNGGYYPGIIASVNNEEKTATIEYDDGDEWERCPFSKIKEAREVNLKCCPQCAVIIYKHDGCDSMTCLCGESFEWSDCRTIPSKLMDVLVENELEKKS